jgi:hypothetical protein
MSLKTFIRDNHEEIISEFSAFAKTLMPSDADMSEEELRDHAAEILTAVAKDMGISQTADEEARKSQGLGPRRQWRSPRRSMRTIAFGMASVFERSWLNFGRYVPVC